MIKWRIGYDKTLGRSADHFRELIYEQGGPDPFLTRLRTIGIRKGRSTVSGWMSANAKRHTFPAGEDLIKIADLFNVTTDWLLGRDSNRQPSQDNVTLEKHFRERQHLFESVAETAIAETLNSVERALGNVAVPTPLQIIDRFQALSANRPVVTNDRRDIAPLASVEDKLKTAAAK